MFIENIPHWNPVEESKDIATFEGSLHSKMSTIILDHEFWDMLKYKSSSNTIRWSSAVLKEEVRKEVDSIRNYIYRRDDF